ncbi:unnamed protein product [Durusdinium trenchii]|uniref:Uncharacterized protein n=1 Tax=Durusdinium trenchii TaxID=1381693 RepID=A0ABP0IY68_9DINO
MSCCQPLSTWCWSDNSTFGICSLLCILKDYPHLAVVSSQRPTAALRLMKHLKVNALRRFLTVAPMAPVKSAWSSLLFGLSSECLCRALPSLLNEVEVHLTLAAVMNLLEPGNLLQMLSRVPPTHLLSVCRASPDTMVELLSHVAPNKVRETILFLLLEPQEVIDHGLLPLLLRVRHPKRLALIINAVEKEVLLHLLRHVPGEQLATLVNVFEDDEGFEPDGPVVQLLQEASRDYKLLQEKVTPLIRLMEANKTASVVSGVQPSKLLDVLRQVDCNSVLTLMANANENFVVNILAGPLDGIAAKTAPGVAEVMNEFNALLSVVVDSADQAYELVKSASSEAEVVSHPDGEEGSREVGDSWGKALRRCWAHEAHRVFYDRLVTKDDQQWFQAKISEILKDPDFWMSTGSSEMLAETPLDHWPLDVALRYPVSFQLAQENFKKDWKGLVKVEPLIWCDFLDPKANYYQQVEDPPQLVEAHRMVTRFRLLTRHGSSRFRHPNQVLNNFLVEYNTMAKRGMDLVLFMAAAQHVSQVVWSPSGRAAEL